MRPCVYTGIFSCQRTTANVFAQTDTTVVLGLPRASTQRRGAAGRLLVEGRSSPTLDHNEMVDGMELPSSRWPLGDRERLRHRGGNAGQASCLGSRHRCSPRRRLGLTEVASLLLFLGHDTGKRRAAGLRTRHLTERCTECRRGPVPPHSPARTSSVSGSDTRVWALRVGRPSVCRSA